LSTKKLTVEARTYTKFGGGVIIEWAEEGTGFGQIYIEMEDGELTISAEAMSKDFIKEVLCQLVDQSSTT
jgi:hypothetical protein